MNKYEIIKKSYLVNGLAFCGFKYQNDEGKTVFSFVNSDELQEAIRIILDDKKIYIEYNGSGHDLCVKMGNMTQEYFDNRERARYYYMKKLEWKAIFINSPRDYLPSDEAILQEINKTIEWFKSDDKGHSHYNVDIGLYIDDDKYEKLRRIKEEDLETT